MPSAYAGIGSRETPAEVLALMELLARALAQRDWTLRSGMSPGADQAFYRGAVRGVGKIELFLPWPGFEADVLIRGVGPEPLIQEQASPAAHEMAASFHPDWEKVSAVERDLLARDIHEVLGRDLAAPVALVLCWTPDGDLDGNGPRAGGTGQTLRVANAHAVPVLNLARPDHALSAQRLSCGNLATAEDSRGRGRRDGGALWATDLRTAAAPALTRRGPRGGRRSGSVRASRTCCRLTVERCRSSSARSNPPSRPAIFWTRRSRSSSAASTPSAAFTTSLLRSAGKARVGGTELGDLRSLIWLPGPPAEREQAHAVRARPDLPLWIGSDANHRLGVDRMALAVDLDLARATEHDEDLLLSVCSVVVLRVLGCVGGHVDDLHSEGLDAELRPRALEGAEHDRLHVVDSADRVVRHLLSPFARLTITAPSLDSRREINSTIVR